MKETAEPPSEPLAPEAIFSRETAVECPHFMAVAGYIGTKYCLPKYVWRRGGLLYHYTDAAGLLGIVSTNRLWATDVDFLNDPSEGTLFPKRLLENMRQKPGGLSALETEIIDLIEAELAKHTTDSRTFSVSFCGEGDLLSQWRGYGSFGSGYAIGFDPEHIVHPQLGRLIEVQYGVEGLEDIALDLLSIYVEASPKWGNMLCDETTRVLLFLSLGFKDSTYSEERETRILTQASDQATDWKRDVAPLRFRTRGSDIVPYISLPAKPFISDGNQNVETLKAGEHPSPLPIRRIVTGPGVDYSRAKTSLERLLKVQGYEDVDVIPSAVPFRC